MSIVIKCIREDQVYCPYCGSGNIVAGHTENSHCGNCGKPVAVEINSSTSENNKQREYTQLSLFDKG